MTSPEAVTSLELSRSYFDSTETEILSTAFERAWSFVEFDPLLTLNASERQAALARCLMAVLKYGNNRNPLSLANTGISLLRKSQESAMPSKSVAA